MFKEFKAPVRNTKDKIIKVLRTNNVGTNLKNSVRSAVWQGRRLLHIHLNKMEL
jgi:hypothetical protein